MSRLTTLFAALSLALVALGCVSPDSDDAAPAWMPRLTADDDDATEAHEDPGQDVLSEVPS